MLQRSGGSPGSDPSESPKRYPSSMCTRRRYEGSPTCLHSHARTCLPTQWCGPAHRSPGTDIAQWIVELSEAHERVDAEEVVAILNEARSTAGIAAITNQESVEEELQRSGAGTFATRSSAASINCPASSLVDTVTMAVDHATNNGSVHAPILIDDLVDTYEVEAQEFLDKETENVRDNRATDPRHG